MGVKTSASSARLQVPSGSVSDSWRGKNLHPYDNGSCEANEAWVLVPRSCLNDLSLTY